MQKVQLTAAAIGGACVPSEFANDVHQSGASPIYPLIRVTEMDGLENECCAKTAGNVSK